MTLLGGSERRRGIVAFIVAAALGVVLVPVAALVPVWAFYVVGAVSCAMLVLILLPWIFSGMFPWTLWRKRPR